MMRRPPFQRRPQIGSAQVRAALRAQRPIAERFDHSRLPDPASFYERELGALKGSGPWRDACARSTMTRGQAYG